MAPRNSSARNAKRIAIAMSDDLHWFLAAAILAPRCARIVKSPWNSIGIPRSPDFHGPFTVPTSAGPMVMRVPAQRTRAARDLSGTSQRKGRDHTVLNGIALRLRQSLVLPVLLILAGVLSFAGMMGYIDAASARAFVRMWWPAVLVLIGLEIMVARMRR